MLNVNLVVTGLKKKYRISPIRSCVCMNPTKETDRILSSFAYLDPEKSPMIDLMTTAIATKRTNHLRPECRCKKKVYMDVF